MNKNPQNLRHSAKGVFVLGVLVIGVLVIGAVCLPAASVNANAAAADGLPDGVRYLTEEEIAEFRKEQDRIDMQEVISTSVKVAKVAVIATPFAMGLLFYLLDRRKKAKKAKKEEQAAAEQFRRERKPVGERKRKRIGERKRS